MVLLRFPFASPAKKSQGSGRSNDLEPCGDEASLKYPTLGVKDLDTAFKFHGRYMGKEDLPTLELFSKYGYRLYQTYLYIHIIT